MGRRRKEIPAAVAAVRERIDHWRETRAKRSRMPEHLWGAAASVAAEHGTWFVSRVLRVNYGSLQGRVDAEGERPADSGAGFVELQGVEGAELFGSRRAREMVLELSRPDGASVRVRVAGDLGLDVLELARAFWRDGA